MAAPSSARGDEGLSLQTLLVASAASAGAAIIVSLFWRQGTVIAAAITPVLVALLRELFHRPAQALSTVRPPVRRPAMARAGAGSSEATTQAPAATAAARAAGAGAVGGAGTPGARLPERGTEALPTQPAPIEADTRALDDEAETRPL